MSFQTLKKMYLFKEYFDPKWIKLRRGSLSFHSRALWRIHYNFLAWLGLQMHNNIPRGCDLCTNYHRPQYRVHFQDISLPNYHAISISAFDVLSKMIISFVYPRLDRYLQSGSLFMFRHTAPGNILSLDVDNDASSQ